MFGIPGTDAADGEADFTDGRAARIEGRGTPRASFVPSDWLVEKGRNSGYDPGFWPHESSSPPPPRAVASSPPPPPCIDCSSRRAVLFASVPCC